jgi:hypothetical protein
VVGFVGEGAEGEWEAGEDEGAEVLGMRVSGIVVWSGWVARVGRTSINSPRSSASEVFGSVVVVGLFVSGPTLFAPFASFLSFEYFFACLLFLGFGFSTGAASALRTDSLKQSRKVS